MTTKAEDLRAAARFIAITGFFDTEKKALYRRLIDTANLLDQQAKGEVVAIVGERGCVSWRSETILPVGAKLYTHPSPAQAEPVSVPDGWMPIETAPKDGRYILLCRINKQPFSGRYEDGEWIDPMNLCREPSHWMPMPAAPQPGESHD
jgi:hypothetical protein